MPDAHTLECMGPESPSSPPNPIDSAPDEVPDITPIIHLHPAEASMPVIEFRPYDVATFFQNAPEDIQDILIREAYLARAAEILVAQQEENQRVRERVDVTRPPFMAFRKEAKAEFEAELAKAEKEVEFFGRALAQNETAMDNLRKSARRQLEVWLRNHDTTYMSGLACEQFLSDWRNAVDLVKSIMLDFIKAIGEARNLMVTGYDKERQTYTAQALEALNRAVKVGAALEADTASVNLIAEKHDEMFRGTIFDNPFPRLPIFAAEHHVANAKNRPIGTLQKHFDRIKGYYEEFDQNGIPALNEAIARAEQRQKAVEDSYMTTLWEGLRQEARKSVEEEKLEEIVKETEERFLQGDYL